MRERKSTNGRGPAQLNPYGLILLLILGVAGACSDDSVDEPLDAGSADGPVARDSSVTDASSPDDATGVTDAMTDAGPSCADIGTDPPLVTVLFPPRHSLTDEAVLTVRGTATDATGIAAIEINGTTAVSSDGFASWQLEVPLDPGANQLVISSTDDQGNYRCLAAQLDVHSTAGIFVNPGGLAMDAANNRAFVVDDSWFGETVLSVDLSTGGRRLVSGPGVGTGPYIHAASDVVLGPAGQRVFVANWANHTVYAVDIASGDRSELSSGSAGSGPVIAELGPIALDAPRARLVAADMAGAAPALVGIDLATGARTTLSSSIMGAGPGLGQIQALAVDPDNTRAFIGNAVGTIAAVDLATGDRSLIATGLASPEDMRFDEPNSRLVVVTAMDRAVRAVDVVSGAVSLLSNSGTGAGIVLDTPRGLALDPDRGRVLVSDLALRMIVAVDLATGDRMPFSSSTVGSGAAIASPTSVALHFDAAHPILGRPIVWDNASASLLAIDLSTGARTVLVDTLLNPPRLSTLRSPVIVGDRLLAGHAYTDPFVVEFDLAGLTHSVVAASAVGTGPYLANVRSLALDGASGTRALVSWYDPDFDAETSEGYLTWVDLATGDRTHAASPATASLLHEPLSVLLLGTRALVFDQNGHGDGGRFVDVDLTTGAGTVIPDSGIPVHMRNGWAMIHDTAENRVLVALTPEDGSIGGTIMAMNLSGQARVELSGDAVGRGPHLRMPFSMVMDARGAYVYVTEALLGSVFAVDLTTGERVIVSR